MINFKFIYIPSDHVTNTINKHKFDLIISEY